MKLYKNMENTVVTAIEILFYHTNMNLLAFHADNVNKRKHELSKTQRKKQILIFD